jgi:tetratricopeptide (TPR) repeat protein
MEEAYCQFCLGYLDKAQEIYQEILDRHNTYPAAYVPYFRLGEIYFIKGDHIEALNLFDQADLVIGSMLSKNETNVLLENRYRIKVKMAHIYWMLGSQYIDLSLGNIEQAKDLYDQMVHKEISLKPTDRFSLLNNLCWYKLDKFLSYVGEEISARDGKSDQLFEVAWAQFDELKPVLDNHEISSNALDTAAWFCYTHFQRSGDEAWLLLSVDYAKRMLTKRNRGTMKPLVTLIHSDHVTSIASAARELGVWGLGQKSR